MGFMYRFNPRVLAGGRDYNLIYNEWFRDVSIHASSREDATHFGSSSALFGICFNPRVLAGGRDSPSMTQQHFKDVSIHASSREDATKTFNFK